MMSATAQEICLLNEDGRAVCVCMRLLYVSMFLFFFEEKEACQVVSMETCQ